MNFKKQNNCVICKKKITDKKNLVAFKKLPLTEILVKSSNTKKKLISISPLNTVKIVIICF